MIQEGRVTRILQKRIQIFYLPGKLEGRCHLRSLRRDVEIQIDLRGIKC
jgi:hypothetical protein